MNNYKTYGNEGPVSYKHLCGSEAEIWSLQGKKMYVSL